jgi:hypothetical protein
MTKTSLAAALLAAAVFCAHGAQAQNIVVQGGTLIDGTGRAPIEDSVIVIEGNRFKAVGRRGEVPIPPGAHIIDIRGKTVLPGFIDGHCHWESFWGEVYLHLGITTCVQIETQQNGPWGLAQKEGTEMGRIRRAGRRLRDRRLARLARLHEGCQRRRRPRDRSAEEEGRL